MKTEQALRSRLKALNSGLDFALKQRDECKSTHMVMLKSKEAHSIAEKINLLTWVLEG